MSSATALNVALASLFSTLLLSGCGVRDARYRSPAVVAHGRILPPDVEASSSGIFPMEPSEDPANLCCWISPRATLKVRLEVPKPQKLVLGLYVPDTPLFSRQGQRLDIFVNGVYESRLTLMPGFHVPKIPVNLREARARQSYKVQVISTHVYEPGGAAGPRYGALLTSVYFE